MGFLFNAPLPPMQNFSSFTPRASVILFIFLVQKKQAFCAN